MEEAADRAQDATGTAAFPDFLVPCGLKRRPQAPAKRPAIVSLTPPLPFLGSSTALIGSISTSDFADLAAAPMVSSEGVAAEVGRQGTCPGPSRHVNDARRNPQGQEHWRNRR